jgi:sporulation protein YlmC with PRC-barrel domain
MKKFGILLSIVALLSLAWMAWAAHETAWNVQSTGSLVGSAVETRQGEKIGDITDLVVDPETGHVAYVAVSTGGDKVLAVPWKALQRSAKARTFVLDKDKAALAQAPSFARNALPTGDRRQGEAIYAFYGQQPYWSDIPVTIQSVGPDKTTATVKLKQGVFPEDMAPGQGGELHMAGYYMAPSGVMHFMQTHPAGRMQHN